MKSAVVRFPGSNCERDVFMVLHSQQMNPHYVWHHESALPEDVDLVVVPGGFTYGDYLRCGAMAAHSEIMQDIKRFADRGGYVLGICNGFQILCEARLLPGTLMRNSHLTFNCKPVSLMIEHIDSDFTQHYQARQVVQMPIAHHDGNYFADDETLKRLKANHQILFRYCDENGLATPEANPNGSRENIAGICNETGNVLGLMPHPERHADASIGNTDGLGVFTSLTAKLH